MIEFIQTTGMRAGLTPPASNYALAHASADQLSFLTAGWLPVIFFSEAGLDLPKEPLKIFPFFVFLSPLPMIDFCWANVVKKLLRPGSKLRYAGKANKKASCKQEASKEFVQ